MNPALEEGAEEDEEVKENEEGEEDFEESESEEKDSKEDEFDYDDYFNDDDEIPAYKLATRNSGPDDDRKEIPFSGGRSFHEMLNTQLGLSVLNPDEYHVAEHLIGNIDDDGYLRRELADLVDDLAFTQNIHTDEPTLDKLLKIIQTFDPPGIGARSLQECLLIQLRRKKNRTRFTELAIQILDKNMEEFSKKHYDKIAKKLEIGEDDLKEAVNEILKLNPKPGNSMNDFSKTNLQIIPDFAILNNDGNLELSLNSKNAPDLKVSKAYGQMLQQYTASKDRKAQKEAISFVKQKLDDARWFIDAIEQRQQTLMLTMQAIMNYQYEYLLDGDETKMKPMILKDIAEIVGLDISTISRVANSKYVQTPFGTFLLKSFFSESLQTDAGDEVSTREVKKILEDCIGVENKKKPLTDDKLTKILKDKGYNIARRTVAKYREQLEIPVARMRKEL